MTTLTADDVRVARVHLRLGQLTLARAELEDLLRQDVLDPPSLAVLAEARWRTGDSSGAADAAIAHIEAGGSDDVALCIAAEAAAAEGRADEARGLMDRLPVSDAVTLDALFAGMPRRAFWPAGPVDRSDLDELRQGSDLRGRTARRPQPRAQVAEAPAEGHPGAAPDEAPNRRSVPGPREVAEATDAASWGAAPSRPAEARPRSSDRRMRAQLDPMAELARARNELDDKQDRAFLRLALVLRHDPTLAPMVLDTLRLRREPAAALLRGDAQRLLGRHLEAEAAFDAAAESLEAS